MRNKNSILLTLIVVLFSIFHFGCACENVPAGYVGIKMEPGGLSEKTLYPGNYTLVGRDMMYLIDSSENVVKEPLSILCADDLNFKFDLKVRSKVKKSNPKAIIEILKAQGSKVENVNGNVRIIKFKYLYETYVKPQARSIARGIVAKYETEQIRENRSQIQGAIQKNLIKSLKGTPMEITMVVTSNFDYPDVITQAVEKRRKKEIEIKEEKARQAMELLRADNRLKLALKMKQVRAEEADAESTYHKIIGSSLTTPYLRLRELENQHLLFGRAGKGDKIIITTGGKYAYPLLNIGK